MTGAESNGRSYWSIDTNGDPEKLEQITDAAMKQVLQTMQQAIVHLTNQQDTRRLQALQACTNQLYKQADTCLSQKKKMTIADD